MSSNTIIKLATTSHICGHVKLVKKVGVLQLLATTLMFITQS